jgi:hypothetical protein
VTEELPENSITFVITFDPDEDTLSITSAQHTTDGLDEEQAQTLNDIYNGICLVLDGGMGYLKFVGGILSRLQDHYNSEIEFEPDDELVDAVQSAKIIKFPRKLH